MSNLEDRPWVTLDTGGINLYGKPPHGPWLTQLEKWEKQRLIVLAHTPAGWDEFARHHSESWKRRARAKAAQYPRLTTGREILLRQADNPSNVIVLKNVIPTPLFRELFETLFPGLDFEVNRRKPPYGDDALHITYHVLGGADYFVSVDETHILSKRAELAEKGVIVLMPEDCVRRLAEGNGWAITVQG